VASASTYTNITTERANANQFTIGRDAHAVKKSTIQYDTQATTRIRAMHCIRVVLHLIGIDGGNGSSGAACDIDKLV
jgi:hypothetical protein